MCKDEDVCSQVWVPTLSSAIIKHRRGLTENLGDNITLECCMGVNNEVDLYELTQEDLKDTL